MFFGNLLVGIYFILGGIGTLIYSKRIKSNKIWEKYITYLLIVFLILSSLQSNDIIYIPMFLGISGMMLFEHIKQLNRNNINSFLVNLILIISLSVYSILAEITHLYYLYILVLVNDGFAQLGGQLFGKIKFTKISPNKNLEGLIFGITIASITFVLLTNNYNIITPIVLCISAILGDLSFSYFKRKSFIKDYANYLPGHGGFSDRFDSLAGATFLSIFLEII